MKGRLTQSEWQRIADFAETPKHQRCPEQLLPDCADEFADASGTDGVQVEQ